MVPPYRLQANILQYYKNYINHSSFTIHPFFQT